MASVVKMTFSLMLTPAFFEKVGDDEVLRHRLARRARLGDDVEAGLGDVDDVQKLLHADGVDVVLDKELRTLALALGQIVVVQVAERVERHDGAERRPADAEHDKVVKFPADQLCRVQEYPPRSRPDCRGAPSSP